MFGTLGIWEILLIVLLLVVIFGAKKLPQLGKGLGEGIRNFKDSVGGGSAEESKSGAKDV